MPRPTDPTDYIQLRVSPGVRSMADVRYVLTDLHGGTSVAPALLRGLRPDLAPGLEPALLREKDAGAPETIASLLRRVPGGLAVHVEAPRLLVDLNRGLPGAAPRHCLANLPAWIDTERDAGRAAARWALALHRALRGPGGILGALLAALGPAVPVWDFHTYDPIGADGRARPQVQLFQALGERSLVSAELCGQVQRMLPDLEIAIDDPYTIFEGCLLPAIQGRPVFASEFRKDLMGAGWGSGSVAAHAVESVADQAEVMLRHLIAHAQASARGVREQRLQRGALLQQGAPALAQA